MRKKTEEKRQSIVEAAFDVFREVGFDQASMADIAARSGASKATLYSYFSSKEELYAEAMTSLAAGEIHEAFGQLTLDVPLRESLVAFGRHYLPAVLRPSILAIRRLCFQGGDHSRLGRAVYEAGPKRGWALVRDFLASAIAAGSVRECDPGIAARHLEALYEAELLELAALGYAVNTRPAAILPVVERAVDVFIAAYGACGARPDEAGKKAPARRARKSDT
ncbi:TetR/AcrR family transcriptional regulator [Trinickia caryophylli]|uniref:Transcriptional regulator, TetR family n=1 Tax=Trinickia caryophylli TaxID=28094 RepID=A0A1X7GR00_TRICW|nr:TetR/AcrR family transcriptional regulator [Trinickia caryophylli]PMS10499.1 TetR/AcrR family transcriptional regulator [Trinickia caryophylli]TRX19107.1 TetR/AcrR family transcriptional regulator [Trinickia caryophylli]WQE13595.1 TetR/AcrR family transcriptional regulator [Trinickia caryophylli]SMF72649.1 transcriptional regulator, TetR family [Trinickia caryophylli]GLU35110.1 TetR family transcriptional regulator [Trinickia caryophylli]